MKKATIAVVSYNAIPPYRTEIITVNGKSILFLPNTFNPKCEESVRETDANFQLLMKHEPDLEHSIVFAGKKESGALRIIELFVKKIPQHKLLFVLCAHDFEEKMDLLERLGILPAQIVCFADGYDRCVETPFLLALTHCHLGIKNVEHVPPI